MRDTYLFDLLETAHGKLIDLAEKCPADKRDTIPSGFNNNVRWQVGHVLTAVDSLLHRFTGQQPSLPASFQKSYGGGSKPADWDAETPDWDTIIAKLREQPAKIRAEFAGKLNDSVLENFAKAETLDELLNVVINHENLHMGQIGAMIRILG